MSSLSSPAKTMDFTIASAISHQTFTAGSKLHQMVKKNLSSLNSNLTHLDINSYLNDAYKLANRTYFRLRATSYDRSRYLEIHNNLVFLLSDYFGLLNEIMATGEVHPYINILNQHPLVVENGLLFTNKRLVSRILPEKKGKISGGYGEGLVRLLLSQIDNVQEHGILKVGTSNRAPSPDFIIIDKFLNVLGLAEVKSSINHTYRSPDRQVKNSRFNGLGINVFFNNDSMAPIEFFIEDPSYDTSIDIMPSIYSKMAVLEALVLNEGESPLIVKNTVWAKEILQLFHENLQYFLLNNYSFSLFELEEKLPIKDEHLFAFLKRFFDIPEINIQIENELFKYSKIYHYKDYVLKQG